MATLTKCDTVVHDCAELKTAQDAEIKLCNDGLNQLVTQTQTLNQAVEDKDAQLDRIYRNPIVMFLLGAVVYGVIKR